MQVIQPVEVLDIYDNGGETFDRYSIHILLENGNRYLICTSYNPFEGVFSRAEPHQFDLGKHLGTQIDWDELPLDVQKVVIQEIA
jgi:hypothetical protein